MTETATVPAEQAPLGVLLWPVSRPESEKHFTLTRVEVVRREVGAPYVRWVYRSGVTRDFGLAEEVVVGGPAALAALAETAEAARLLADLGTEG